MLAPEELRQWFWRFVRFRAYNPQIDYMFTEALELADMDREALAHNPRPDEEPTYPLNDDPAMGTRPRLYRTIQEAFLDFLIDEVGQNNVPRFRDWLRAQALIMAQVACESEHLTVSTPVITEDGSWGDELTTHTMLIAPGPWDALSLETFDFIARRCRGYRAGEARKSGAAPAQPDAPERPEQ